MLMRRLVLAAFIGASAVSCTSPTSPSTTTQTGTVPGQGQASLTLDVIRGGTMTVTLTWTDGSKDLSLALTGGDCAGCCVLNPIPPGSCPALDGADVSTGTKEELTHAVQQGEKFKAWVSNKSNASESFTI